MKFRRLAIELDRLNIYASKHVVFVTGGRGLECSQKNIKYFCHFVVHIKR